MWTESLYTWASSLGEELEEGDFIQFFENYFRQTDVLQNTLLLGLGIGAAFALVFYYVCCNVSIKFGNIWAWAVALLFSIGITFVVSSHYVLGSDGGDADSSTGFYSTIYETQSDMLDQVGDDQDERQSVNDKTNQLITEINDGTNNVVTEISMINMLYCAIIFFVFSMLITKIGFLRQLTSHGKATPF